MSIMNRGKDLLRLRNLAHELKSNMETESGPSELRTRSERQGIGRRYSEDMVLTLHERRLSLTVTRWVRDSQAQNSYYAGRWRFQEDLRTGSFLCNYSR